VEAALLAKAILAEANAHHDVETLKNAALQAMALAYRIDRGELKRHYYGTIGTYAFCNLGNMPTLHERLRLVDVEIIGLVALLTADDQDIAKTLGGDEAC
jgi:hypothetical protein